MNQKPSEKIDSSSAESKVSRFRIETLEERIAPLICADPFGCCYDTKGHYNPQGKWVGGGRGGRYIGCY